MNALWEILNSGYTLLSEQPMLLMALVAVPLVLIAALRNSFPEYPLVVAMAGPCVLSLLMIAWPDLFLLVAGIDLALIVFALGDLFTMARPADFTAERQAGRIASLRQLHRVVLTVTNRGSGAQHLVIRDDAPPECEPSPPQFRLRLGGRSRATVHYHLRPVQRGVLKLEAVHLKVRSRLGLWQRYIRCPVESVLHVYPDMKQLSEYAVLARTNRLRLMGVRRTRRVGQDNDFERLRDYTRDDNPRHIDWRSTARRSTLTVKDFQTNQSQRLVFLIDCGRMMTNSAAGVTLLDHALNSMLMLSYVALRQGDSVGLLCFSDQVHTFVPPKGGMNQMNQLLHASFDRFPQLVESRYDQAFLYLSSHVRKRSLVVLISNVIDEVNAASVEQYLTTLVGRHLPLGVLLRDHRLFDPADQPHPHGRELFRAAAAAGILNWRHQVLTDLEHKGVLMLDVFPEDMTAPLVNRYLDIKGRHLL